MAKSRKKKSPLPLLVAVAVAVAAVLGLMYYLSGNGGGKKSEAPIIGGAFELVDQNGKPFTQDDLKGKYSLIYFGYTFCPDVCPTELQAMSSALELLGPLAKKIRPVMISVDPDRDKPEVLKEYLTNFYPGFVGLTGTPEQVRKAARAYRAYYKKVDEKGSSEYLMDHSSIVYFMDPEGRYLKHFAYGTPPEKMADGIKKAMKEYKGSS